MTGPGRWGDRRQQRIGLLGGSFNPAHAGHRHVAEIARRALRLDQVWLLVSPGNPLKPRAGMAPFVQRLAGAREIAESRPWLVATDLEARLGTRFTVDTLAALHRLFPRAQFVLLIGADNLAQLPHWRRWTALARDTPIAVLPRPGWTRRGLSGQAALRLRRHRRPPGALLSAAQSATGGASNHAPWCFVPAAENPQSATAIREAAATRSPRIATPPDGAEARQRRLPSPAPPRIPRRSA